MKKLRAVLSGVLIANCFALSLVAILVLRYDLMNPQYILIGALSAPIILLVIGVSVIAIRRANRSK